jgi:hypothetical protein
MACCQAGKILALVGSRLMWVCMEGSEVLGQGQLYMGSYSIAEDSVCTRSWR